MNGGYLVGNWLSSQLRKKGAKGLKRELTKMIGSGLAGTVTDLVVKGAVSKAVTAIGGKIGAFAGPLGIAAGVIMGWL